MVMVAAAGTATAASTAAAAAAAPPAAAAAAAAPVGLVMGDELIPAEEEEVAPGIEDGEAPLSVHGGGAMPLLAVVIPPM
jgi:hypothetical protein